MGISAVYGLPGKGKSSFQVFYGLFLAEKYQKKLVSNFLFNPIRLAYYCKLMGYTWLFANLHKGIIYYISCDDSLDKILSIKDCVVLLDEAGIYLPARGFASTPKSLLKDFCQVRHDSQYLIYSSQSERQVDIALRNLTEEVFWCNGISLWDANLRNEKLISKTVRRFTCDAFEQFLSDPKLRKNPIKVRMLSNKSWTGLLKASDKYIFELYDSFGRLEAQNKSQTSKYLAYNLDYQFPRIEGINPFRFHKFSGLISFLFKKLPSPFLRKILILDRKLSRIVSVSIAFSSFEKKLIKWGFFYLLGLFFLGFIL